MTLMQRRRSAAEWEGLGVVCPVCYASLTDGPSGALVCVECNRDFPQPFGIPDFRLGTDPYLSNAEDLTAAERLAARAGSTDFAGLFASYYEGNGKVTPAQVQQFTRGVLAAEARSRATIGVWNTLGATYVGRTIDLGCGTAPLAAVCARGRAEVIGVDVGMRWLVLAAKRLSEAKVDVPLLCANAESLPFSSGLAGTVVGESIVENVADGAKGLAEVHRVLRKGGQLCLTTPSKWFLGPDPHVGVLAGSWRSQRALRALVARSGAVFPKRTLFSPRSLAQSVTQAGFAEVREGLPRFAPEQVAALPAPVRVGVAAYGVMTRLPVLRSLAMWFGPSFVLTARRS